MESFLFSDLFCNFAIIISVIKLIENAYNGQIIFQQYEKTNHSFNLLSD